MRLNFNLIGFLYVIIFGVISYIFNIPEIVKAFLALPSFLIIPIILGESLLFLLIDFLKLSFKFDNISKKIISFLLGVSSLILFALILNSFNIFNFRIYSFIILSLFIVSGIFINRHYVLSESKNISNFNNIALFVLIISIGLIGSLIISEFSPYPLFYGSDLFRHNQDILSIAEDSNLPFNIPYMPTFALLTAVLAFFFNLLPDSFSLLWTARFLTYPLYSLGIFLFAFKISKRKDVALLSSLISIFIWIEFVGLWNFTPKLVIYVIFPYLLYLAHDLYSDKKTQELTNLFLVLLFSSFIFVILNFTYNLWRDDIGWIIALIIILLGFFFKFGQHLIRKKFDINSLFFLMIVAFVSILFHSSMGLLLVFILLFYRFLIIIDKNYPKIKKFVFYILTTTFLIIVLFNNFLPEINIYEDSPNVKPIDISSKYNYLKENPNLISPFILIPLFILMFTRKDIQLTIILSIMLVYFLKIVNIERVLTFLPPFISYIAGSGLLKINEFFRYNKLIRNLYPLLLIVTLIIFSFNNLAEEVEPFLSRSPPDDNYALFNEKELSIGKILRNTPKETVIISDTYTDAMLVGISNRKNIPLLLRSNYYPEKYPQKLSVISAFKEIDAKESHKKILSILNDKEYTCEEYYINPSLCNNEENLNAIIVLNKKTFGWLGYNQKNLDILKKFDDKEYFTKIYVNTIENIYVFGVNPEPGVPFNTKIKDE